MADAITMIHAQLSIFYLVHRREIGTHFKIRLYHSHKCKREVLYPVKWTAVHIVYGLKFETYSIQLLKMLISQIFLDVSKLILIYFITSNIYLIPIQMNFISNLTTSKSN